MHAVPPFAVALTHCPSYTPAELDAALAQVLTSIDLPNLRSAKILLKPNLISAKHGALPCTEAAFMLAAARYLLDQGAQVSLGDSPAFGTATMVLQALGITEKLTALGVEIRNFRKGRNVPLRNGDKAFLAEAALACDLLVNLPRVKAHAQARLTLAVKNCFGCVLGTRKAWWHMKYGRTEGAFHDRLAQIPLLLPPILSLVDGVVAMHKSGPIQGEAYSLNLVAAGMNPVAVDTALHQLLGITPEQSPVMAACCQAQLPGAKKEQLVFPLEKPEDFQSDDFLVPDELNPVRFSPFRFLTSAGKRMLLHRQGLKK